MPSTSTKLFTTENIYTSILIRDQMGWLLETSLLGANNISASQATAIATSIESSHKIGSCAYQFALCLDTAAQSVLHTFH